MAAKQWQAHPMKSYIEDTLAKGQNAVIEIRNKIKLVK